MQNLLLSLERALRSIADSLHKAAQTNTSLSVDHSFGSESAMDSAYAWVEANASTSMIIAVFVSFIVLAITAIVIMPALSNAFFGDVYRLGIELPYPDRGSLQTDLPLPNNVNFTIDPETGNVNFEGSDVVLKTLKCISPTDGSLLGYVPDMDEGAVQKRISLAANAQKTWAKTTFKERKKVLSTIRDFIIINQEELCEMSSCDTGKTMLDGMLGEILTTLEKINWLNNHAEKYLQREYRDVGKMSIHKSAYVEFVPIGVIAAIAPFNYPFHNMYNPLLATLFAGNAIVIKPSEYSSWSSIYFANIAKEVLKGFGHSPDLVQVVTGDATAGKSLVENPGIGKIFFTGSTKVGKMVALSAAKNLTPVVLELGGKDPFVICDDADFQQACHFLMRGVFQNVGQNCVGIERVFVQESIEQKLIDTIAPQVAALRVGHYKDQVDLGALTMGKAALDLFQRLVDDAVSKGATLHCGGKVAIIKGNEQGFYYEPTMLSNVTADMDITKEEVFGPIMVIRSFKDDEHLLSIVNDCPFALGSSVFSLNKERANYLASNIRAGMCNINDFGANYLCQSLPFGGTKESGIDKFAGIEGIRGCCLQRALTVDRFPGIRTNIPKPMQYPMADNAYAFVQELICLFYERGLVSKVDNLRNMILMLMFKTWKPKSASSGWVNPRY